MIFKCHLKLEQHHDYLCPIFHSLVSTANSMKKSTAEHTAITVRQIVSELYLETHWLAMMSVVPAEVGVPAQHYPVHHSPFLELTKYVKIGNVCLYNTKVHLGNYYVNKILSGYTIYHLH